MNSLFFMYLQYSLPISYWPCQFHLLTFTVIIDQEFWFHLINDCSRNALERLGVKYDAPSKHDQWSVMKEFQKNLEFPCSFLPPKPELGYIYIYINTHTHTECIILINFLLFFKQKTNQSISAIDHQVVFLLSKLLLLLAMDSERKVCTKKVKFFL